MANTLKFKRGLLAGLPAAAEGEPLFTTDTADLYIGTSTGTQKFQKFIASGTTSQYLRGDGSLATFPTNVITGTGVSGQIAYFTGTNTQAGNNGLFWDITNGRLGVGTNSPGNDKLRVTGSGRFESGLTSSIVFQQYSHYFYNGGGTNDIFASTTGNNAGSGNFAIVNTVDSARIALLAASNGSIRMGNNTQTSATATNFVLHLSTGNVVLNSSNDTGQKLQVAGNVKFDADAATNGFYWDNTNKRLGIGKTTPTVVLDIAGPSNLQSRARFEKTGTTKVLNLGADRDTSSLPYIGSESNHGFSIITNDIERVRFDTNGAVGIGSTGLTGQSLRISKPITGAATSYGLFLDGQAQSDVNGAAVYVQTNASTQAATFTMGNLYHFLAAQGTFGAGTTVATQRGFLAASSLIGATNNFGFDGQIPSGTGRWNLYMQGSASNYINGSLAIGTTTFNDNVNPYKAVVFYATSGSGGGGLMVTSNQAANAANAMVSAVQWGLNDGSVSKPSGLFFNYSNTTHGNRANNTVGNLISRTLVAAANLSITNNNGYISHVDLNSTSNDYVNYQGYLYVQRNSGTVNVNSYTSFRSMYQTAVGSETITDVIDFRAAQPTLSTGALVTNRYGLLIDFNNTQVTNAWGIYQSSSTVKNHINGNLILGSTSDTGEKLQVTGGIKSTGGINGIVIQRGGGSIATNTGVGSGVLTLNTSGFGNLALGYFSLYNNTSGYYNTAVGYDCLYNNTDGFENIAIGFRTLYNNSGGDDNIAIGYQSGLSNTTGNNNIFLGYRAGNGGSANANTTGGGNIIIGFDTVGESATESNRTFIGNNITTSSWLGGRLLLGSKTDDGVNRLQVTGTALISSTLTASQFRLSALNTAPATASSTGTLGEIVIDDNHIYVCTATNTWKRVAIATF